MNTKNRRKFNWSKKSRKKFALSKGENQAKNGDHKSIGKDCL
jgi:hypothetical protein